jgi:hypothetical protein
MLMLAAKAIAPIKNHFPLRVITQACRAFRLLSRGLRHEGPKT